MVQEIAELRFEQVEFDNLERQVEPERWTRLRALLASVFSQAVKWSANGSSTLGRSGTMNFGSTPSERRYFRMVFRDRLSCGKSPGWIDGLENASVGSRSVTPCRSLHSPLLKTRRATFEHGSILDGNIPLQRVSSQ
jgi:hypothetical protein